MPRTKKPAGTTVDRRNGRRLEELGPTLEPRLPRPRHTFEPTTLDAWDGFWTQDVAATVTEADWAIVWAWIEALDDAAKKRLTADLEPLVTGSMGQLVANPLYQVAASREAVALQCARQLGIGPRNRMDLGLALYNGQKARAEAAAAAADAEGDEDDDDADDPRRRAR